MILRLFCALALFVTPSTLAKEAPAPPADTKRALKFHRPHHVGDTYRYTAAVSQSRTMDVIVDDQRQPGGSENLDLSLEGILEVTKVTPEFGNVLGMTFNVEKMSLTDGQGKQSGLEPGTVITASRQDDTVVFTAQGRELDGLLKQALELGLPAIYSIDESTDAVLAPPGPVAPGETWEMNRTKLADTLKKMRKVEIDADRTKATVTYKGTAKTGGIETDTVIGSTHVIYTKLDGLPENYRILSSTYNQDTTTALPRDTTLRYIPSERSVAESKARFAVKQADGDFELEVKTHLEIRRTSSPK